MSVFLVLMYENSCVFFLPEASVSNANAVIIDAHSAAGHPKGLYSAFAPEFVVFGIWECLPRPQADII